MSLLELVIAVILGTYAAMAFCIMSAYVGRLALSIMLGANHPLISFSDDDLSPEVFRQKGFYLPLVAGLGIISFFGALIANGYSTDLFIVFATIWLIASLSTKP